MKGEWKVFSNFLAGVDFMQVGRIKDTTKPVHSGNIEYADGIFYDKKKAEAYAQELNRGTPKVLDTFGEEEESSERAMLFGQSTKTSRSAGSDEAEVHNDL